MSAESLQWRPTASRETLEHRARLLAHARGFFARRSVLEVETPMLVRFPVTDVHLRSARVVLEPGAPALFLRTSPEYAMKRMLAAGCGDIFQICKAVRGEERGRLHNPEFTLIEWYRLGFTLEQLMQEVDRLVRELLGPAAAARASERITYREAFLRELGLDPLAAGLESLAGAARELGYEPRGESRADRDEILDFLMAVRVGPRLGTGGLAFVHGYPASQAALAAIDPSDGRLALRFELYCDGVELANGFRELASAREQRARFETDRQRRRELGLQDCGLDERLLAALEAGLPECAGVALGFDRVVMIATGARHIDEVLAFPAERA
jgi:elongation factor P--(R)-beta-lysine ligase